LTIISASSVSNHLLRESAPNFTPVLGVVRNDKIIERRKLSFAEFGKQPLPQQNITSTLDKSNINASAMRTDITKELLDPA